MQHIYHFQKKVRGKFCITGEPWAKLFSSTFFFYKELGLSFRYYCFVYFVVSFCTVTRRCQPIEIQKMTCLIEFNLQENCFNTYIQLLRIIDSL